MILTDREIEIALQHGHLGIEPRPDPDAYSSTSVDLTLSDKFATWKEIPGIAISPGAKDYKYSSFAHLQEVHSAGTFQLHPKHFVLAWTAETVKMPSHSRYAARVEGKSSLARLGISVHVTAPTIHCGWIGTIQLEMFNFGPYIVNLDSGMKVCQLIFELTTGTPQIGYRGQFLGQQPIA
jgi:dCTP deaminase